MMLDFLPPDVSANTAVPARADALHELVRHFASAYGGWRTEGEGGDVAYRFGTPESAAAFMRAVEYRVLPVPRTEKVKQPQTDHGFVVRVWAGAFPPPPVFDVPEGIDPHWQPDDRIADLPKWFKVGVKLKVKRGPMDIMGHNPSWGDPGDRYISAGEVGVVEAHGYEYPNAAETKARGEPSGTWDYRVVFPRGRYLTSYDLTSTSYGYLDRLARVTAMDPYEKRSKFILVDEALAEYGAGLISDEYIMTPAGKATSVRAKIQGKKLIFESDKGQKLATGPIDAATVRSFVEAYWFWKPK